ncbi:MAG: ribonuclease J [Clostridia bacterium]|nr:ribonuclease J [Clostridia bacterium]
MEKKELTKDFKEIKKRKPYTRKNVRSTTSKENSNLQNNPVNKKIRSRGVRSAENTEKISTQTNAKSIFKPSKLKVIPLGGLHEVGKNITVFEYENEMIIVDCGISFPEDDMLGIDLVIPDITYVEKNKEKLKGMIITHGHEDHIGSIPYFLKKVNTPIYATKLTCGLINNKLEEHKLVRSTKLIQVDQGETITLGKFKVEFIRSSHSIPDSVMLAIYTPVGTILHTGDFKVDYTPIDGKLMDLGRIAELGNQGILALMSDSTNAERKGFTMSESTVGSLFEKLFLHCTKRIVVATFASNVHRVQQIVNSAVENDRKIAVCGRSMINMIETARALGYIDCPENLFIDIDMINKYPDEKLVIITTGSQGEPMSALTRMAAGDHRKVKITPNDLIIISATPIPGNEKFISKVIDDLMQIGAEVVYSSLADVHVSGHACQEEQKLILALARPKFFIPVHGEYRQLKAHSETAQSMGVNKDNIIMLSNGRVLELTPEEAKVNGSVPSGRVFVDGLGVGDVGNIVLRDRQHLSQDGLIIIVLTMDSSSGEVISGPDVISRGFVYVRESENLMDDVKSVVKHEISKMEQQGIRDWGTIKTNLRENLRDYIMMKTKRDPMIIPIIMEV